MFEQQIKDENQTTLELSDRIIASPRKLTVPSPPSRIIPSRTWRT